MKLENPNLPTRPVSLCAVSAEAEEIVEALEHLKIGVYPVEAIDHLDWPIASHADMQLHHLGAEKILVAQENPKQISQLTDLGFQVESAEALQPTYPGDVLLNAARIGAFCICKQRAISEKLNSIYSHGKIKIIDVAQGYAKCSSCILNETSLITADPSIAKAAYKNGLNILLISSGQIDIAKYNTGFIGGCCGKLDCDVIAFTGDIAGHEDYTEIRDFIKKCGLEIICLTGRKLFDIGGICPLCEID